MQKTHLPGSLKHLFHQAALPIAILSKEGIHLEANKKFRDLLRITSKIKGLNVFETESFRRTGLTKKFRAAQKSKKGFDSTINNYTTSTTGRYFERIRFVAEPVEDNAGDILYFLLYAIDQSMQAQQEREQSSVLKILKYLGRDSVKKNFQKIGEKIESLIPSNRISITLLNRDKTALCLAYLYINYKKTGTPANSIFPIKGTIEGTVMRTGKYVIDDWDDYDDYDGMNDDKLQSSIVYPLRANDNTIIGTINLCSRQKNIFTKDHIRILDQFAPAIAIAIQREHLFEEITESEEKYRTLVEKSQNLILLVDDRRVIFSNDAITPMLGYTKQEVMDENFDVYKLVAQKSKKLVRKRQLARIAGKNPQSTYEFFFRTKNNKDIPIITNTHRIKYKGKYVIQAVHTDITERKKLEADLAQAYIELKRIFQYQVELIRSISHEIRTPLTVIRTSADVLGTTIAGSPQRAKKFTTLVQKQVDRIDRMLTKLTLAIKLDSGNERLWEQKTNMHDLVSSALITVKKLHPNVTFRMYMQEPIETTLDVHKMEYAMEQVLDNAGRHTPKNGIVRIHVKQKNNIISVVISDTGTGISKKNLANVFTKQYYKKGEKWTRLGLFLTKEILELHDGSVLLKSAPGKGTTVTLTFPQKKSSI